MKKYIIILFLLVATSAWGQFGGDEFGGGGGGGGWTSPATSDLDMAEYDINSIGDLMLINTTAEDTDGGRESTIIYKGTQSGSEVTTLATIQAAHDGAEDNEKGYIAFSPNDGTDGNAPTERLRLDSAGLLRMSNDAWIGARNNANSSDINMFKINTSDEIDVGATLVIGASLEFAEDTGVGTAIDMPVSATPADEVVEGYYMKVDGSNIFSFLASANSTGGVYGERVVVNSSLFLNDAQTFTDSDATPDVRGYSNWETNTSGVTIIDFDWAGKTIPEGQLLVVVSKGAIVYDVTASGIKGGTTNITTAAGDLTAFIYDGADWIVIARMDMSDDLN